MSCMIFRSRSIHYSPTQRTCARLQNMQMLTTGVKVGIPFKRRSPSQKMAKKTRARVWKVKVNQKLLLQRSKYCQWSIMCHLGYGGHASSTLIYRIVYVKKCTIISCGVVVRFQLKTSVEGDARKRFLVSQEPFLR